MVMDADPEAFETEVRFNEYDTDKFSVLQLRYPGARTAHALQVIGIQTERRAALYFDKATIYLPDFQAAYSMTVIPTGGETYTVDCPPDINGFEYQPELFLNTLQDEFAIATVLFDMRKFLNSGSEVYPLREALDDAYFWLLMNKAASLPWKEIKSHKMPWHC